MSKRKKVGEISKPKNQAKSLQDFQHETRINKDEKSDKKSGEKKRFLSKKVFVSLIFFLILVLVVVSLGILFEYGIFKNIKNPLSKPVLFVIEDRCSLIVGQLISTIADEESCELRCKTECNVREMTYVRQEFVSIENDCNTCNCYCK